MKTSKEMQLKIIDKMRENVESDFPLFGGVQCFEYGTWRDEEAGELLFEDLKYRIKPETITINGVEIPKPLSLGDLLSEVCYYVPSSITELYEEVYGAWCFNYKPKFIYKTKEQAITASKALFGIDG